MQAGIIHLLVVLWAQPLAALDSVVRSDLEAAFSGHGVTGTFVLLDVARQHLVLVNPERAGLRLYPASTFKIANSLLALETGVVGDENEIIPYGGARQPIRIWERDMSMRDAIGISNVPVYQELARRIGKLRYDAFFEKIPYGNGQTGDNIEQFWLRGPLAISAIEQVHFLAKLAVQGLDVSIPSQEVVRDIIRLEIQASAVLYGKTGWTNASSPEIGWFVGWVERDGDVFSFALNLDIHARADADKRIAVATELLKALDVYSSDTGVTGR